MSTVERTGSARSLRDRLTSDGILGALVAALSILTALVGFQAYLTDAASSDKQIEAIKELTESNTEYLVANQDIIVDYSQFDEYYLSLGEDDEVADYFYGNFSQALTDSMARESGPFDEQYYDEMFALADETYQNALNAFDEAEALSDTAEEYQLIMLLSAVGLALTAWSSLVRQGSATRLIFLLIGIAAFVVSVGAYLVV